MSVLVLDTETTGFPPAARMVQLAALLFDNEGNELDGYDAVIQPDGWEVPLEAAAIHGFTTEICATVGVPLFSAMERLIPMLDRAVLLVAHNWDFDARIIGAEITRTHNRQLHNPSQKSACTMRLSTDICRLPQRRGRGYKWPTLNEAYAFFFGKQIENAHHARADARACAEIFFELRKRLLV